MSRYLILVILNAPFIIAGLTNSVVAYKLGRMAKKRLVLHVIFWAVLFTAICSVKAMYEFLFSNNLTNTEPLSLFDVMQITGIIGLFFIVIRQRSRIDFIERRVQDMHRELSITLSQDKISASTRGGRNNNTSLDI